MATIVINDKEIEAEAGRMIIEVADDNNIYIPRFCYHKKLSIAANCRMCLVEVEKVGKAVPACATPVTDGMKVFTKSEKAVAAQKSVMEFLLINHPLDCPICDQGGECELQDISMGYGSDVSRYSEEKRSVEDENLGSLIATDMTRCIHCTRCVRFGEEVAGVRELGATGRGESTFIGTYIEHSLTSEVSGNVIDLCPVGALTSRPYRYTARAWELQARPSLAPFDCLGTNISLNVRRGEVMRVLPRENADINESWVSDRDRFGYVGIHAEDRLMTPMIKQNGQWKECDWETALNNAAVGLQKSLKLHGIEQLAGLASPQSTTEEAYLFQKLIRGLGSNNIDHRLHACDFSDDANAPLFNGTQLPYHKLDEQQAILLVGSNIHREQPLVGLRIRNAAINNSQREDLNNSMVMSISPIRHKFNFPMAEQWQTSIHNFVNDLAAVAKASLEFGKCSNSKLEKLIAGISVSDQARAIAKQLADVKDAVIIVGHHVNAHPQAATLRSLIQIIAEATNSQLMIMTDGPNSAGASLAGALPHRQAAGVDVATPGLDAHQIIANALKTLILLNIEPEADCYDSHAANQTLVDANLVIALTAYKSPSLLATADVLLPITTFAETSGTYFNFEGHEQHFHGAIKPIGQSRPAWKVLRVLANLLGLEGFDYMSTEEVMAALQTEREANPFQPRQPFCPESLDGALPALCRISEWSIYSGDALVRRSAPLQAAASNDQLAIYVHPAVAKANNLRNGKTATVTQTGQAVTLPVVIDEKIPDGAVFVASGRSETRDLGPAYGPITLK